jgi:hypothetical protein
MSNAETEKIQLASSRMRESSEQASKQAKTGARVVGVWTNSRYHIVMPANVIDSLADMLDSALTEYERDLNSDAASYVAALKLATAYLDGME